MTVKFESDEDKARQRDIADRLSKLWKCDIIPRGPLSAVDWSATRDGRLVAVLELKCRTTEMDTYPTLYVSDAKRNALLDEAETFNVPGFLVVSFTDALCYVNAKDITGEETMAGREPRPGSAHDIEPIIKMPIGLLRLVAEREE